ncbi:MAG: tyrosine-protein phosphatase [Pontibacterium sp.]
MIDLHSHLIPGIDDGAKDLDDALNLLRVAKEDGIKHITFTPHVHPGRFDNVKSSIQPEFEAFKASVADAGIEMSMAMAGEVRLSAEILAMVAQDQIPFLGEWEGKKVMLLELPHSHVPPGSDKLVKWLIDRNILPMIAHPERNKDVVRDIAKIYPFIEMGCLLQVTSMSIAGRFGGPAEVRARELLQRGWVTVLATDAHNMDNRPPILSEGRAAAENLVGKAAADALVFDNPAKIVGISL